MARMSASGVFSPLAKPTWETKTQAVSSVMASRRASTSRRAPEARVARGRDLVHVDLAQARPLPHVVAHARELGLAEHDARTVLERRVAREQRGDAPVHVGLHHAGATGGAEDRRDPAVAEVLGQRPPTRGVADVPSVRDSVPGVDPALGPVLAERLHHRRDGLRHQPVRERAELCGGTPVGAGRKDELVGEVEHETAGEGSARSDRPLLTASGLWRQRRAQSTPSPARGGMPVPAGGGGAPR